LGERLADDRVDDLLVLDHAGEDGAEPLRVRLAILRAVHFLAEAELLVFGGNLEDAAAGDVHLVEGLHGGQPRRAALVGVARACRFVRSLLGGQGHAPRRSRSAIMVSAARAAKPPLSPSSRRARAQAWASFSTVRM